MALLNSGPKFQGWVSKEYFTNSSLLPSFATAPSNTKRGHEQHGHVKSVPVVVGLCPMNTVNSLAMFQR